MTKIRHHIDRDTALRALTVLAAYCATRGDLEATIALLALIGFITKTPGTGGPQQPAAG